MTWIIKESMSYPALLIVWGWIEMTAVKWKAGCEPALWSLPWTEQPPLEELLDTSKLKFLHYCCLLFYFLFNSIFHTLLLLPITFGCLHTGCQNRTITRGVLWREQENELCGLCHHKKCEWKIIGKCDHISLKSQLTGQTMKDAYHQKFHKYPQAYSRLLKSCGLLLSWLPVCVHLGNTQACPSAVKPWGPWIHFLFVKGQDLVYFCPHFVTDTGHAHTHTHTHTHTCILHR